MTMKKAVALLVLVLTAGGALAAQTPSLTPSPTPAPTPAPGPAAPKPTPEPYTPEEFPGWLLSLRHAEIIFFGSLPFAFLLAIEGVEVGRYFAHGQDPDYRPFPFRAGSGVPYTWEEQMIILGSTCAIALTVAVIDFIISEANRQPPPAAP
ncbi:MAG: hypothetical protein JXD23_16940 [Spirochaetales bacterium]|nr:hypothetical protein [Spirochaetales bacterium]